MHIYAGPPIHIPRDQNLTELLHAPGRPLPDTHPIAGDALTGRRITLGQLRDRAGRLARGLHDRLHPADQARWALIVPGGVDFLEMVHAILWTGGVVAPINWALRDREMAHGLVVSRPQFVVVYGKVLGVVQRAIALAAEATVKNKPQEPPFTPPVLLTVIESVPGVLHATSLLATANHPLLLPIPHHPDTTTRLATIHLSSGTTGTPKGVALSHYNYVANVRQLAAHDPDQFHPAVRTVTITPWAHIGMTTLPLFAAPYLGLFHLAAMPPYDFAAFVRLAADIRATHFQGPASVVLQLAQADAEGVDVKNAFSSAETIYVGGPPFPDTVLRPLLARAPWQLTQVYGMTEAAGYVAHQRRGDPPLPPGAIGPLLPGIEACLKREGTGEDVPPGDAGELWLRGPNITAGYVFQSAAATAAAAAAAAAAAFPLPGWYNTGDVGRFDAQGRLYLVGRTKELIKYKGFQVAPQELEAQLLEAHAAVAEAGVAATWQASQLTELPTAWVVLRAEAVEQAQAQAMAKAGPAGTARDRDAVVRSVLREIHAALDARVSGYKKLRGGVYQVAALPKNATGKILRKELERMRDGVWSLEAEGRAEGKAKGRAEEKAKL